MLFHLCRHIVNDNNILRAKIVLFWYFIFDLLLDYVIFFWFMILKRLLVLKSLERCNFMRYFSRNKYILGWSYYVYSNMIIIKGFFLHFLLLIKLSGFLFKMFKKFDNMSCLLNLFLNLTLNRFPLMNNIFVL